MTCFSPEVMDPLVPFSEGCILHWPATFLIIQGATDCICGLFGDVMIKSWFIEKVPVWRFWRPNLESSVVYDLNTKYWLRRHKDEKILNHLKTKQHRSGSNWNMFLLKGTVGLLGWEFLLSIRAIARISSPLFIFFRTQLHLFYCQYAVKFINLHIPSQIGSGPPWIRRESRWNALTSYLRQTAVLWEQCSQAAAASELSGYT